MTEIAFLALLAGAAYSYVGYPIILALLPSRASGKTDNTASPVSMSLIITAHNEEKVIARKIENSLALDPGELDFELIVASDASTDSTDEIVEAYASQGVRLVRAHERRGKEYAQSLAVREANAEILVFSDVGTEIPKESLQEIAVVFEDPQIGAVSSEDQFISDDGTVVGEGLYVQYEMWLRRLESQRAGLVGLSGSFFAARADVCEDWDIISPSDFNTALNCARKGLIAVSSPSVIGVYKDIKDPTREYQRKVRTVVRGMTAIARNAEVLNVLKHGLFSFQVISHKLMRWLVPWLLLALFVSTSLLYGAHWIYRLALYVQIAFYASAILGAIILATRRNKLVRVIYYFCQVNVAIAHASIRFLLGQRITTWQPTAR